MDDLSAKGPVVDQTLKELDVINKYLGGNQITLKALKSMADTDVIRIADLGCGSGEILRQLLVWGQKSGKKLDLTGIDANPNIVKYARKQNPSQINFQVRNIFDLAFSTERYDFIIATLFTHHFTNEQLVESLRQWHQQASKGIIINDLHRHILAYRSIQLLTRLFSRSHMVKHDAPLSVARSFTKDDWIQILREAGITNYKLTWRWAFRWELLIYSSSPS
jgi:2-polyprenyl-3-methyl-5-hydroxy-6-metoxy-1,4-benzoquinol methylase